MSPTLVSSRTDMAGTAREVVAALCEATEQARRGLRETSDSLRAAGSHVIM